MPEYLSESSILKDFENYSFGISKYMNNSIKVQAVYNNTKFEIENTTDLDKTNMFFQEILISGGKILINDKTYEVIGPIDSKVRLEYLFCTGEMFLPNYEKNR